MTQTVQPLTTHDETDAVLSVRIETRNVAIRRNNPLLGGVSVTDYARWGDERQDAMDELHTRALVLFPDARRDQLTDREGRLVFKHGTVLVRIDTDHGTTADIHLLSAPDTRMTVAKSDLSPAYR
jgi:hypothetical protein